MSEKVSLNEVLLSFHAGEPILAWYRPKEGVSLPRGFDNLYACKTCGPSTASIVIMGSMGITGQEPSSTMCHNCFNRNGGIV